MWPESGPLLLASHLKHALFFFYWHRLFTLWLDVKTFQAYKNAHGRSSDLVEAVDGRFLLSFAAAFCFVFVGVVERMFETGKRYRGALLLARFSGLAASTLLGDYEFFSSMFLLVFLFTCSHNRRDRPAA